MSRPLIFLYVVLVLTIVVFGWLADMLWGNIQGSANRNNAQQYLSIRLIEKSLRGSSLESIQKKIENMNGEFNASISLAELNDFSKSSLYSKLVQDEAILVEGENSLISYLRVKGSPYIVELVHQRNSKEVRRVYVLLTLLFYLCIALAIYLWVWPLSRDLNKLKKQVLRLGDNHAANKFELSRSSAVYPLARSFSEMSQRLESLLTTQKEMTHAISHELRTPLARMKFSLVTLEQKIDERNQQAFSELQNNISEMEKLISQFLSYASLDSSKGELDFQLGDIEAMVSTLCRRLRLESEVSELVVESTLSSPKVVCEWYLMEHSLENLLVNASRYAKSKIRVRLFDEGRNVCIDVEDDGIGVLDTEKDKVFDAFFRKKSQSNSSGFGLGLAIVRRVLQWHCGEASVGDRKSVV